MLKHVLHQSFQERQRQGKIKQTNKYNIDITFNATNVPLREKKQKQQ